MNNMNPFIYHIFAAMALAFAAMKNAHAEGAAPANPAQDFGMLPPMILIFVVLYFLLIRPQQKQLKKHKEMLSNLKKGDEIITGGGLLGKITDTKDDILKVDIADGVRVKVQRSTVSALVNEISDKESNNK